MEATAADCFYLLTLDSNLELQDDYHDEESEDYKSLQYPLVSDDHAHGF
jgi:hypothetical protein